MKPAVLFIHSNSELYGADFILLQVVQALRDQVRPIVALPGEGPLTERLRQENVQVVLTRDSVLRRVNFRLGRLPRFGGIVWRDTRQLVKLIRAENVQLVYSNTGAIITGALAARKCRLPHLYHLHEIIVEPSWLARGIARLVLGNSSEVIAVSGAVQEYLLKFSKPGDPLVKVVHNGIDPRRFDGEVNRDAIRRELGAGPENVLFGVIGRIHPWKGQSYFIEAARLLLDVCPKARFAIIGGTFAGYEYLVEELKQQVQRLALKERLKILPHREDIPALMQALDVFVLPSTLPDPLPTVVLEAMAARRPVVATAHGGALEMVLHGETGLLAPYKDVSEFSQALLTLAQDELLRQQMGENGRQRLEEYFSLQRFQEDIVQLVTSHLPATVPSSPILVNPDS